MITIVHDLGARRTYNKIGVGEYAWQQHLYAIGDKQPHYPMPALRVDDVLITSTSVYLWIDKHCVRCWSRFKGMGW